MHTSTDVLEPSYSWYAILLEAQRWINEDIGCQSIRRGKTYYITGIQGQGQNSSIHIEREAGHQPSNLGFRRVRDFLARFHGEMRMSTSRVVHRVDVAILTVIVNLHPFLSYLDDMAYIIVLDEPKFNFPGARYVNPASPVDRSRAAREARQGQPRFRRGLLTAYQYCCCISGTNIEAVVDAAHIIPYATGKANHSTNGLLLRADIHNLFDDGLIKIHPNTLEVQVNDDLKGSVYEQYNGTKIKDRADGLQPDHASIQWHFNNA